MTEDCLQEPVGWMGEWASWIVPLSKVELRRTQCNVERH